MELQRQQRVQQQNDGRQREVEEEEVTEDVEVMTTAGPDHRGQKIKIGTRRFAAPFSFNADSTSYFKRIELMLLFDLTAVLADAESEFNLLSLYTWDD